MKQTVNTIPMINISSIVLVFWVNVTNEAKRFFTRCACLVLQADHLSFGIGKSQVVRVPVDNLKAEVIHGQRVPVDRSDIATRSQEPLLQNPQRNPPTKSRSNGSWWAIHR